MDVTGDQAALEVLGICREHAEHTRSIVDDLHDMLERQSTPATPKTIALTQAVFNVTDDAKRYAKSIGLYNPTSVQVVLGLDGARATTAARGIAVPPTSLVVLPIGAMSVEIGLDPSVAAALGPTDAVVVTLLRYEAVQAAFLGKGV